MTTSTTFSLPLENGGIQMLQLSVHIFSVRAVEGTGPYRFVEYVTRATCGSAVNENQLLASDTLLDDDNIVPDELFMLGRQYGGDDLTAEVIKDPPENLFVSSTLGQTKQYKYQYFAISTLVGQVADAPAVGGAAVRGAGAAIDEVSSDEEEDDDKYSIDSDLSADAEIVETQAGLYELEERFDPNLSDEEEVVETQLCW